MNEQLFATILTIIVAILTIGTTNILRKALIKKQDLEKMVEVNLYRQELLRAKRRGDQKVLQKLEKKKDYIRKVEINLMKKNLTVLAFSMTIFFMAYWLMISNYAWVSLALPGDFSIPFLSYDGKLSFYGWYLLIFFAVSLPFSKLFGFGAGIGGMGIAEKSTKDEKQEKKTS